ncbi:reverse transcriptase domain-containing protein [Tanacetum coccineum]
MEELCQPSMNGRGGPIASLTIQDSDFNVTHHMTQQVKNACQFHGLSGEDANKHIDKFVIVSQSMKQNGATLNIIRLYLFPDSLTHHATAWFDRLPKNSIHTFKKLVTKFLSKYFPPSMDTINAAAGGTFMKRRPEECLEIIENMTAHHNDWDTSASRGESSGSNTAASVDTKLLLQKLKEMNQIFLKNQSSQQIHAITLTCETCDGPHYYYECSAADGYTRENIYAAGNNQYQQGDRNLLNYRSNNYLGPPGALPSNTVPNPREQINSITTRSGKANDGPSIPPLVSTSSSPPVVERDPETSTDKAKKVNNDESQEPNPCRPRIPYLARLYVKASDRSDAQMSRDLGKFLIPCSLQDLQQLGLGALKPTRMSLELTNRSVTYPTGIAEDVMVRVDKFNFLADFIVVDFEPDPRVPIILGRPFLRTPKGLVDLYEEKLTLRVENEEIIFYADNYLKNKNKQYAHSITIIDFSKDKPISDSTTIHSDTFLPSSPPVETSDSSIDKFVDELTLLDSFPPNFEDGPVFERFTFELSPTKDFSSVIIDNPVLKRFTFKPTPVNPSPPGDVDDDYQLDDKPVYEQFTFELDPFMDFFMIIHDPQISYLFLPPFAINPVCEKFTNELAHPYPFPPGNEDVCFDPGAVCDKIEFLLYRDPSSPPLTIDSILEGFTDEPPLGENDDDDDDDLFDLSTGNDEWRKLLYDVPFDNDKSFDMTTFMDDVFPTPSLTYDLSFYGVSSGDDTLLSFPFILEDKLFDPGIHEHGKSQTFIDAINERIFYLTIVNLLFEDHHYISLLFFHGPLFLLNICVESSSPLSSDNEDTIFDPGIIASTRIYSFIPGSSHRGGTFIYLLLDFF